jgi:hypothetical protein
LLFAKVLGFSSLKKDVPHFHYAEDLLQIVTIAVCKWIEESMKNMPDDFSVIDWMHHFHNNNPVAYELAYACYYYFVPYWVTRSALKWNKVDDMKAIWRWWIHLFIATNKRNYVILSLCFLWILELLDAEVKQIYNQYRVLSFTRMAGLGIPWDGYMELVCISASILILVVLTTISCYMQINRHCKRMNKNKPTVNRIKWTTTALNHFIDLQHDIDSIKISKTKPTAAFVKNTQEDADNISNILLQS